jgi:hypothetical protein
MSFINKIWVTEVVPSVEKDPVECPWICQNISGFVRVSWLLVSLKSLEKSETKIPTLWEHALTIKIEILIHAAATCLLPALLWLWQRLDSKSTAWEMAPLPRFLPRFHNLYFLPLLFRHKWGKSLHINFVVSDVVRVLSSFSLWSNLWEYPISCQFPGQCPNSYTYQKFSLNSKFLHSNILSSVTAVSIYTKISFRRVWVFCLANISAFFIHFFSNNYT